MCVKLVSATSEIKYNASVPLEMQIKNCDRIVVNYEPKDPDIDTFLYEMERLSKNGISANINVEVLHNDSLKGIKARKRAKRLMKDLSVNEAIKLLVNLQHTTDIYLSELAEYCQKR